MLYRNYIEDELDKALLIRENGLFDKEEDRLLELVRIVENDTVVTQISLQIGEESHKAQIKECVKKLYYKSDIKYSEYDKLLDIVNIIYFTMGKITLYIREEN